MKHANLFDCKNWWKIPKNYENNKSSLNNKISYNFSYLNQLKTLFHFLDAILTLDIPLYSIILNPAVFVLKKYHKIPSKINWPITSKHNFFTASRGFLALYFLLYWFLFPMMSLHWLNTGSGNNYFRLQSPWGV